MSGKHYYALRNHRDEINAQDTVIIRLEELSPFPVHQLRMEIAKYKNVKGEVSLHAKGKKKISQFFIN